MSSTSSKLLGLATALAVFSFVGSAAAQTPLPTPMPPNPETPAAPPPVAGEPTPVPVLAAPPAPAQPLVSSGSDHETIVGRWGIEARRLVTLNRTLGQESGCAPNCPVDLNALSLRRWTTAELRLQLRPGAGRGRRLHPAAGHRQRQDLGHLLRHRPHRVGQLPAGQLAAPGGQPSPPAWTSCSSCPAARGRSPSSSTLRGVIEGELHLGMIGAAPGQRGACPAAWRPASCSPPRTRSPARRRTPPPASGRSASAGPTSLWDLVTKAQLRYYF